jgi:non-canonical poly(A) RNA polymerase PAPD5/7
MLRLHAEIVDFCRFAEPTADEASSRAAAVQRVREVVASIWPGARLEVFGSFATGLYLPTSDIDAVILDSACASPADGLRALALALTRRGMGTKVALIAKARIPIVKFEEAASGFAFDVSFDVANGPAAAAWMRAQMAALPPLRPLSLVLKAFLQQRELNEVYTGGVGSYAMVVMIIAHLRTHPAAGEEPNLGVLLLDFFELFGRLLNAEAVGISCETFFSKAQRGWCDERRPELWAVEDPRDAENDLCRNSFNARAIRGAFDHAHRLLSAPTEARTDTLLGRILHLDATMVGRPRLLGPGAISAVAASLHSHERARKRAPDGCGPKKAGTKKRRLPAGIPGGKEEGEL